MERSIQIQPGYTRAGRLVICLMLMTAAGCGDRGTKPVSRLQTQDNAYLEGVPVPTGFKLSDRNSEDQWSGGPRWARHEYHGSAETETLRTFYKEQMPLLGWNRVTDYNVRGTISMRFERPKEMCDIIIGPAGRFGGNKIQATVMPFQRPTETKSRRPIP